jgi:hypothetical protein
MTNTIIDLFRRDGDEDVLADPRAFAAWLAQQRANDDLGLQESLVRLLEDMAARQPRVTPARVRAVHELDRQSSPVQDQLLRQYLHPTLSDTVRQRLWHANEDLARWLAYTYETMFGALQAFFLAAKARSVMPGVASRMFHYRGLHAKLGYFRYERWIPGRWKALHRMYADAVEHNVARVRFSPDPTAAADERHSAEEEYLLILLLHRVNNGNLAAPQVETVSSWLRGCAHLLALAPPPLEGDGFWLDLGLGDGLLVAKPRNPEGPLLYLDVAPVAAELAKGLAALDAIAAGGPTDEARRDAVTRLALLRRIEPLLRPHPAPVVRRGERIATDRGVSVAVGLAEIAAALHASRDEANRSRRDEKRRSAGGRRRERATPDVDVIEYRSADPAVRAGWRMYDVSESGCRLVSDAQEAPRQRLSGILGIQDEGDDRWKVGIIRRMKKLAGGRIEAGVEIIGVHSLLISPRPVHARDTGYSVDGIDVSAEGRGFDALYLPPSTGGRGDPLRSMLVPASEYEDRRQLYIALGGTSYTVELSQTLERTKDWVWTRFVVLERV